MSAIKVTRVQKGGKHKMKRSARKKTYYKNQFLRTDANKARRAARRKRRWEQWNKNKKVDAIQDRLRTAFIRG